MHLLVMQTNVSPTVSSSGCFFTASLGSLTPGFSCASAPLDSNLISVPHSPPNPPFFSLHPLLHLISLSPSIQIFFIGMTGPVVGDGHRHGGTMHCDGDIHMIMPSDLLQIHLVWISSFCLSGCIFLCVDFSNDFVLSSCYAPACHSTALISPLFSVPACLSLPYFSSPFPLNTTLAIALNHFHSHGF